MRVFVTGATGYVGLAVVAKLMAAGHEVIGLARSDRGIAALKDAGAGAERGTLEDGGTLRNAAAQSDGVIHLAFDHSGDFANHAAALKQDLGAVQAMGDALKGTDKPLITTAHMNGQASDEAVLALAARQVRSAVVSLAPSVHGEGDKAFVPRLISIAREKGVSAFIGDGNNRWPAVHRLDAASLFCLALERAPAGSRLSGVGDEGIPFREIAGVIGRKLNLPVVSVSRKEADNHFGFLAAIAAADLPRSAAEARDLVGWRPEQPGLIADLEEGHYFASSSPDRR